MDYITFQNKIYLFICQILDDPTGNSFVENPFAPVKDVSLDVVHYLRSRQQDIDIGCVVRPSIIDHLISVNCDCFISFQYFIVVFRFVFLITFKVL